MATTKLYLDKRTLDSAGCGTLRLMLSHQNTSTSSSLNIKLRPDEWDGVQVLCRADKKQLDAIIRKKKSDVDMALLLMETSGTPLPRTASEVMLRVHQVLEPEKYKRHGDTFLDVYRKVMAKKDGKTRACYLSAMHKMQAFDVHLEDRGFDDLDKSWFEGFIAFMSKNMSWNGQRNYLRSIRTVFNYAREEGLTIQYPFKRIDMSPAPTSKRCLSLEQIRVLRTMPLPAWQREYRDMFMLMFYLIGINAIDLFTARPDQVVNGRLEYVRSKTRNSSKEAYSIKIEPEAQELLDKYRGKDWLISPMDRYSNYTDYLHHMNAALGKLGLEYAAGKRTYGAHPAFPNLTSYWARHTWSTIAYNLGYSVDIIGQGLGHVDSRHAVTMIYIKPDQRKVDDANRHIIDAVVE